MLKLNASSVVVGAALAVGAMVVMGQAGPQPQYTSWGPPKAGIVNMFRQPIPVIPGLGEHVIYSVPPDRWLTVTVAHAVGSNSLLIAERVGGVTTDKGDLNSTLTQSAVDFGFVADSGVGLTFRPGSEVVLRNQAGSPTQSGLTVNLIGYQTRD